MQKNLENFTARELAGFIKTGEISSQELISYFLKRIDILNPEINAVISVNEDYSLEKAKGIDSRIKRGDKLSPLAGAPILVKDNINAKGWKTTCGSKMLADYESVYSATVVKNLESAGLIIIGKANMDEFAMGSSNEYSYFGPVKNPHNHEKVPGGSSGGSAAAVASGMVPLTLGSDTAGSIRQPASFCGVVGFRPSYGTVSRYGLTAFASSFDQIGPITRDVKDATLLYDLISGYDRKDSTSTELSSKDCDSYSTEFTIGIPHDYLGNGISGDILDAFDSAVNNLSANGIKLKKITLPSPDLCLSVYYILANSEASSNLARFDSVRYGYRDSESSNIYDMYVNSRTEGFGAEVKRRILLGTYALSSGFYDKYYLKAQKARRVINNHLNNVFETCDLILTPTCQSTAFGFNEKLDDPLDMYLSDLFMTIAPLAGIPAISIPARYNSSGLPIGLQLMASRLNDYKLLNAAETFEEIVNG